MPITRSGRPLAVPKAGNRDRRGIGGEDDVRGESLKEPDILTAVDKLATFLHQQPHVGYVADPASYIKTRYMFAHGLDPKVNVVPASIQEIGEGLEAFAAQTPGA
jgi:hypothetical protein